MSIDFSSLNASQLEAVNWQGGPLLVLAGPGSGKTRVLAYRIARLVDQSPTERFRILGVTFTNKAASEMRSRVDSLISQGRDRVTLTTFHSFAAEVLRQHGSHVGLKPDFAILADQADREAVLLDAIKAVCLGGDFKPSASQLLPLVNRLLDQCVGPADALKRIGGRPHAVEIAGVYAEYRKRLTESNQLDFSSLLAIAVELLETKPAIAKQIRRVYSFVCVDEFQDTNFAQFRFLVQLVPETNPNLFVVADDDQLIYQWNGASPARLHDLREKFTMELTELPENYRCPPEVIALANNLIRHNSDRVQDKRPLAAHKPPDKLKRVDVRTFEDFESERLWIAQRIKELTPTEWPHCVILARRKKLLDDTVSTLLAHAIPAYIAIRKNEFQSAPYRWLHATLRLTNAPTEREQLRRMARTFFELEGINVAVEDVTARSAVEQSSYLRTWLDITEERQGLGMATCNMLEVVRKSLVDRLDYVTFVDAAQLWFQALRETSPKPNESAFQDFEDEGNIWAALRADIASHYNLPDLTLHKFLQEIDLRAKEKPVPKDAVRCLTIAASKGMEFHHVFLIGLVEDELPGYYARKKGDASDEMREERRNCFVAITRAEESLTLTFAEEYHGYPKQASRFLAEMGVS